LFRKVVVGTTDESVVVVEEETVRVVPGVVLEPERKG
jgi:hypothetical protein